MINFNAELDLVFKRLRDKIKKFSEQKQQGEIIVKKTSEEIREDLKNSMLTEHEKVLESIDFLKTKRGKELFKKWNH